MHFGINGNPTIAARKPFGASRVTGARLLKPGLAQPKLSRHISVSARPEDVSGLPEGVPVSNAIKRALKYDQQTGVFLATRQKLTELYYNAQPPAENASREKQARFNEATEALYEIACAAVEGAGLKIAPITTETPNAPSFRIESTEYIKFDPVGVNRFMRRFEEIKSGVAGADAAEKKRNAYVRAFLPHLKSLLKIPD